MYLSIYFINKLYNVIVVRSWTRRMGRTWPVGAGTRTRSGRSGARARAPGARFVRHLVVVVAVAERTSSTGQLGLAPTSYLTTYCLP